MVVIRPSRMNVCSTASSATSDRRFSSVADRAPGVREDIPAHLRPGDDRPAQQVLVPDQYKVVNHAVGTGGRAVDRTQASKREAAFAVPEDDEPGVVQSRVVPGRF